MDRTRIMYLVKTSEGSYVDMRPSEIAEMLATGYELTILVLPL